jgi:hypothetical protein
MSKKHKSKQKPQPKQAVAPTKTRNGGVAAKPVQQTVAPPVAPAVVAQPVAQAPAKQESKSSLPFWARMPFAMMDFWMSQAPRRERKS